MVWILFEWLNALEFNYNPAAILVDRAAAGFFDLAKFLEWG
jgi:hypothetical protein